MRTGALFLVSTFLSLTGLAIYVAGFSGLVGAERGFENAFVTWDTRAGIAIIALACVLGGRQIVILSRKLRAAAPVKLGWKDPRRPVVYLRSFSDDASGELTWLAKYRFFPLRLPSLFPPLHTEDEQLADVFREVGPMLAIAQPGLRLPTLGGDRVEGGPEWRARVISLMQEASIIIIRVNHGENLWWELQQAVRIIPLSRLILLINQQRASSPQTTIEPRSDDEYEFLRRRCERELQLRLPPIPSRETALRYSHLWGYIGFDCDGSATMHDFSDLPTHRYRWFLLTWWKWWKPLVRPLRSSLSVYLNRFAVDPEPHRRMRRIGRLLYAVSIAGALVAGLAIVNITLNKKAASLPTFIPEPKWQVASRRILIEFGPTWQMERAMHLEPTDLRTRALMALSTGNDSLRPLAENWLRVYTRAIDTAEPETCSALTAYDLEIHTFFEATYRLDDSELAPLVSLSEELLKGRPSRYERPSLIDARYWQSFYSQLPSLAEGERLRRIYIKQTESRDASGKERCDFMKAALEFYWWLPTVNRPHWANALWGFFYE